ncbi:DUF5009 domain-containing protein [Flavihumibacter solisilvae]|uniref:DUF5009 domain-containing protein n=1 Tax=Flavihumibacter solisilvae TaxID=1349421 RepID=A0A0C1IIQ0_9BACT|nr:DUF5009 domain-containing protein [Flavihumibacter solisilvae]KIC94065.1 hypothetical protein OI18_13750 [Flavihumibacter solisilvae]
MAQQRNISLDALRGFSILAMVLSSSIAFGILPSWMYHAQVPPPYHKFDPALPGISWVDLVFPFFLFSMGAAIPLSLQKKVNSGSGFLPVFYIAGRRFVLLAFFALFTVHMRSAMLSGAPQLTHYLLSIAAFVLLFFQFFEPADERNRKYFLPGRFAAFTIALLMLFFLPFKDGNGFSWTRIDIILLVLANMALFGTITWWLTRHNTWLRIGIVPFIMAVFLGASQPGTWNEVLFNWSPMPALYKFYYLKYLFIIIPGTIAGEWIAGNNKVEPVAAEKQSWLVLVTALALLMVVANTVLLFAQHNFPALVVTLVLSAGIYLGIVKAGVEQMKLIRLFFIAGTYSLLLGLFFNAWEGGIKKDPSTYSYYFVTAGLAFFMLIVFYGIQLVKRGDSVVNYLALNGRNPMVAYVAGNLLLLPILHATGLISIFTQMETGMWTGIARGVLFTGIVSLITIFFTKRKWLWKT